MAPRLLLALVFAALLATPAGAGVIADPITDPTGLVASDGVALLDTLPNPGVIGARFRGEHMFVTSVAGLTVYDVSEPAAPVVVGRLPLPHWENEDVDLGGDILLISNDATESRGVLYVIDIGDPTAPALLAAHDMEGLAGVGGAGHTASCILDCRFAWVTDGGAIRVIDLTDPAEPVNRGTFPTPAGGSVGGTAIATHDVQVDGDGYVWVVGYGGTYAYRLPAGYDGRSLGELVTSSGAQGQSQYAVHFGLEDSGYNDYVHHNSLRPAGSSTVYVTEEDYSRPGCRGQGSFQRWQVTLDNDTKLPVAGAELAPVDLWTTELGADVASPAAVCSAHYFELRDGLVAIGWYEQGLRFLDVTGAEIRQVGYFTPPQAMTWAAYFPPTDPTGEIVYGFDATHGIDVLQIDLAEDGPGAMPTVTAPIRSEWRTAAPVGVPGRFGYACRLPV